MMKKKRHNRVCPPFEKPLNVDPPEVYGDWSVFLKLSKDRWRARCVCRVEKEVVSYALKYGRSTGCGCHAFQKMAEANKAKLTGRRFGSWHVIGEAEARGNGNQIRWICRCKCVSKGLFTPLRFFRERARAAGAQNVSPAVNTRFG
jgi:hypothetical protein